MDAVKRDLLGVIRAEAGDQTLEVVSLSPFGDGHSGFTYVVEISGRDRPLVLRLSPPGVRIAGPADVGRQGRIMAAVGAAGVATPNVIASSSDPIVDGRAFVLMELVAAEEWQAAATRWPHRQLAEQAVETLRLLHAIPPAASGIGNEPAASPKDELERWSQLLERAVVVRESGEDLYRLLELTCPLADRTVLVHGDFHYGNLLFRDGGVAAVLDWEIAELGDPLLDISCLAVASLRQRYGEFNPTGELDVSADEVLALYGVDEERARWFVGLTCFKYAAILGYNLALHRKGKRIDAVYENLVQTMQGLMTDGAVIVRDGLPSLLRCAAACPGSPGAT